MLDKDTYLARYAELEPQLVGTSPPWVNSIRKSAIDRFAEQGFPTPKSEPWRFTRVRPLLQHDFKLQERWEPNGFSREDLSGLSFTDSDCRTLVFVNGHFVPNLSHAGKLGKNLRIENLKSALQSTPDLLEAHLARHADGEKNPFVALNTAYLLDGAFVYIPKGAVVEEPIHLLFVSSAYNESPVSYPRNLVIAEEGSQATIVESYVGSGEDVYFTNAVTELIVGRNTNVDHYKIQKESREAYHFATVQARIDRDSAFSTKLISLGGTLVRNDINTYLDGEGIHCTLDGLYVADGHQHVDNHTQIEHAKPHCDSFELYKGILNGRAKAVFNGKIHVHPDAQKTDAKQSNGCILLSDDAQINTNPQLEIYADDVKCTHGAVVGQIDESAIFYMRSRGINEIDARHTLIYAFANEVLERVKVPALRDRLATDVSAWLTKAQTSEVQ